MSSKDGFINLSKINYNIRLSQLITTYGIGGIVDFVDQPLMVATHKKWDKYIKIYEERLAHKLKVNGFIFPQDLDNKNYTPFVRFPKWYYCPKCRSLKPIEEWEKDYVNYCKRTKKEDEIMRTPLCMNHKYTVKLIAPSILVACKKGHIDDFPWINWAHVHKGRVCDNPQLQLISQPGSLGLDSMKIRCNCGAENSMESASRKGIFEKLQPPIDEKNRYGSFLCGGNLQWNNKKEECDEFPEMVLRNSSNIYFTKIESSLSIPPYSDDITTSITESSEFEALQSAADKKNKKGKLESFIEDDLDDYIESISEEINLEDKKELIKETINRILFGKSCESESKNDFRYEEYRALTEDIISKDYKSRDFKIEKKDAKLYGINEIDKIVLVKKLREVRALVGFTRIKPPDNSIIGSDKDNNNGEVRLVDIKDDDFQWYPGYEVRGEGIFIELNSKMIEKWIEENPRVKERADLLNSRYNIENDNKIKRQITAKFVLLHTLAHLLIKELSFECGYSSASLRERIYCNSPSERNMNGILIYTADSDSEGSLGGLVKQGEVDRLPHIIKRAIKRANWCSYDPVCINSKGQGVRSLNLSACYSCALISETSCEEFNTLLDRALIVGTLDDKSIGFFNKYI